jgi:hypothetical protein
MWGVRDHRTIADYGDAVLGARNAIPQMLALFSERRIRATWATVGCLFAGNRDELMEVLPSHKPQYADMSLSPYAFVESGLGTSEDTDPYHYARSLVERIAETPYQEVGTHTFSHYYCLEPGQTLTSFNADLSAARAIAARRGITIKSLVFPRNQVEPQYLSICRDQGITVFRGSQPGYAYKPRTGDQNSLAVRALRAIDAIMPSSVLPTRNEVATVSPLVSVPASRFFRPISKRFPLYSELHVKNVIAELRRAAENGATYHLWWHPHNFGRNTDANMARLKRVLNVFREMQEEHGMVSATMGDFSVQ